MSSRHLRRLLQEKEKDASQDIESEEEMASTGKSSLFSMVSFILRLIIKPYSF